MEMMPDYTETAFAVKQQGDDSGKYISVYVERTDRKNTCAKRSQHLFEGWRIIHISCPDGYIKIYWRDIENENRRSCCVVCQRCEVKAQLEVLRGFWHHIGGLSSQRVL